MLGATGAGLAPEVVSGHDCAPRPGDPARTTADLRRFGLFLAGFLIVLGGLRWRHGHLFFPWAAPAAAAAAAAWLAPGALAWLYRPALALARLIQRCNTFLLLSFVYYVVVTPYGRLLRLVGKDPLERPRGDRDSYWTPHEAPAGPDRYERQF